LTVRVGTSFIDAEQAARNLAAEISGFDFETVAQRSRPLRHTAAPVRSV
jgi:putative alpha-1,2-mannosidase